MEFARRALGSYIMILMVFSSIMSLLLMLLLNFAYEPDHPSCKKISFSAETVCKENSGYKIKVSNVGGENTLNFVVNEDTEPFEYLGPDEEKGIILRNSDIFVLTPTTTADSGKSYVCRSQGVRLNMETVGKC